MKRSKTNLSLLEGAILPTLVRFGAPFILTSLMTTVYTLTDLFWLGRLSADAVAGVGIIGYMTWLGDAVAVGARTGLGVHTAQAYGADTPRPRMTRLLSTGFQVALVAALLYAALAQLGVVRFVRFFALGDTVDTLAITYARIVFFGMIFKMMHFSFASAYQSLGDSATPFRINLIGLALNVILDPLLIFGFGPFPARQSPRPLPRSSCSSRSGCTRGCCCTEGLPARREVPARRPPRSSGTCDLYRHRTLPWRGAWQGWAFRSPSSRRHFA